MLLDNEVNNIKKICPYQNDLFSNSLGFSGIHSEKYLDSDDICNDLLYLNEYRDSDGNILEYYPTVSKSQSNLNWLLIILLALIIYYV